MVAVGAYGTNDTINFNIPGAGVKTISPTGALPIITDPVTINGYTYRSSVAVMGGKFMVGVANEHRKPAKVETGGTVDVTLELDTEKREVVVPPELAKALVKDKAAKAAAAVTKTPPSSPPTHTHQGAEASAASVGSCGRVAAV